VWKLNGIRRNTGKGRCPLCLGEMDVKHILLECFKTRNWKQKFLNEKWSNWNNEIAYRKILRCTNKYQIRNLGRYLHSQVQMVEQDKRIVDTYHKYQMVLG
jgi:hypothetical protein